MSFGGVLGDIFEDVIDFIEPVFEFINDPLGLMSEWMFDWIFDPGGIFDDVIPPTSPTYSSDRVGNTISEGVFVARCYGKCKIGGNKIRFNDPDDSDLRIIVSHCQGTVNGITEWQINDVEWSELTGSHTKTEYTGTRTQTADARFSTKASAYRSMAYTAFTFVKDDKQIGYNPNITVIMEGLKCAPLAGGADAFTRNPAVILYDWYLNVEGYSAGDLDLNAFKSLEELCDEVPSGATLPRYRLDFNIDTNMSINDAKKVIWASFNGRTIMSQGKIKPIWDSGQMEDGAGSLTAKTVAHAFTLDNIVRDQFVWNQLEKPNVIRIKFKDSSKDYKTSTVEIKDEFDVAENGEILYEETCWYITDAEIARRRARFKYNKKRYADYSCSLIALSGASDLELYDLVTVTHSLPGWTTKQFLVTSRSENEIGRMQFVLEAYYSGVYDDSEVGTQANYASDFANPFVAEPVTNIILAEGGFIAGDGSYVPYVTLTFDKPNNSYWFRGQVFVSTDGSNYTFYGNDTTGDGYRIEAGAANFEERDTLYVKILSENNPPASVVQALSDVSAVSEYIDGKTALPSNVTGFSVSQIGDVVLFSQNRPNQGTDADFDHFELREGSSWSASQLIATYTQTKYPLSDFTVGEKTYMIKAVDSSGNKSATESTVVITLTPPSTQNIFYGAEKITRINEGTGSQIALNYVFDYACGFFVDGTEQMDDSGTDRMNDSSTERMWTAAYDSGYLETESIDIGAEVTGSIYLDLVSTGYLGTEYLIEYKTSTDDITYTSYASFVSGVSATFRYIIFKITLSVDRANYPQNNIKISSLYINIDLPTIKNSGIDETIAASGSTITFDSAYTTAASIRIKANAVSSSGLFVTHELKTKTNFKAHVFNTSGTDVGGTIDWEAEGY